MGEWGVLLSGLLKVPREGRLCERVPRAESFSYLALECLYVLAQKGAIKKRGTGTEAAGRRVTVDGGGTLV